MTAKKVNKLKKIKMSLFKKKCEYCKEKIEKGEEVWEEVKVPEFKTRLLKPFCSQWHAELYKKNIKSTPRTKYCPRCGV